MPDMDFAEILSGSQQELRRGTVVLACLLLLRHPGYGYALIDQLRDVGLSVDANTLYPLLRRLDGETDAEGAKVVKDAVSVPDLLATIATLAGLDPTDTVMSPAGRPIALTDHGAPIKALLEKVSAANIPAATADAKRIRRGSTPRVALAVKSRMASTRFACKPISLACVPVPERKSRASGNARSCSLMPLMTT